MSSVIIILCFFSILFITFVLFTSIGVGGFLFFYEIDEDDVDDTTACTGDPCGDNATCTVIDTGFSCNCDNGYTGTSTTNNQPNCTANTVDACTDNLCGDNAICLISGSGYNCICKCGYTGTTTHNSLPYCTLDTRYPTCDACTDISDCPAGESCVGGTCDISPTISSEACVVNNEVEACNYNDGSTVGTDCDFTAGDSNTCDSSLCTYVAPTDCSFTAGDPGSCGGDCTYTTDPCVGIICPDATDDCHIKGTCTNGTCSDETTATDGTSCFDGTTAGVCTSGVCNAGTVANTCVGIICPDATDDCHIKGTCTNGTCSDETTATDGTSCFDGTTAGVCTSGVCGAACGVNEMVSLNTCVPCPVGTINDAGDDPTGADTGCTADNTGTIWLPDGTAINTGTVWIMSTPLETCDETCTTATKICSGGDWGVNSEATMNTVLTAAGHNPSTMCESYESSSLSNGSPMIQITPGKCIYSTTSTACTARIQSTNFKRLCKCE